jgi:hypothetical protein
MSNARKMRERPQFPKALACGLLEDGGRALFLIRKDDRGLERIEMPCAEIFPGEDPISKLASEFKRQTGIDAEIGDLKLERRHNTGSRKRRHFVPCLVYAVRAKSMRANPPPEFAGFRWLKPDDARTLRLSRKAEWMSFGSGH